jgi:biopolymer transport protein ExbD
MWSKGSIIAVLILASMPGCSRQTKPRTFTAPTEVAKVRVSADGKVYLNERTVTFDELRVEFQRLERIHGGVWFFDESSAGASRQQGQTVKKAIIEAQLPMRLR